MTTPGSSRLALLFSVAIVGLGAGAKENLWSLKPVVRPAVPTLNQTHPIDAFVRDAQEKKGLRALGRAGKETLIRRVYLDLIGLPPQPADVEAFLNDKAPDAYEKIVDRLLGDPQHGVRYARHWLDVLRYADVDGHIPSGAGISHWRDWVISALNRDLPYDRFVRAQLTGDVSERPDDFFATGFLARGARSLADKEQDLAFSAVETASAAFMGVTVACARCHDHMFDPISQRDYYSMKALFDPLVLEKRVLATADQIVSHARSIEEYEARKAALEEPLNKLTEPFRKKLLEERIRLLPPEVQVIVRKPEKERTTEEQKIADDYAPVIRIDTKKILEVMTPEQRARHKELQDPLRDLKEPRELPVFWSVREDPKRAGLKSHILQSGDPEKPEAEVLPGFPFSPAKVDYTAGRRRAFADWLTDPVNPLFSRVAVNRLWQWHFGEGIVASVSDFGFMGDKPSMPDLLDWLASEFVRQRYSMKAIHRLIVTSETYKTSSTAPGDVLAANGRLDPGNQFLSRFPIRRMEAEIVHDAIYSASGELDLTVGGRSFRVGPEQMWTGSDKLIGDYDNRTNRRGIYMGRGYHGDAEMLPAFLQTFDAEDGRRPCPKRNQTVTAPQALALMNDPVVVARAGKFAERLLKLTNGDLAEAVEQGYLIALARPPTARESDTALTYLKGDPRRLPGFTWLLLNLDEFIYIQ
jgi:hypothetical protein